MEDNKQITEPKASAPDTGQNPRSAEDLTKSGMDVIKQGGKYPIHAVIMCVGAAIGHLLGTYIFDDLMTCTSLGMGAGIVAAFIYSRKMKNSQDKN